MKRQSADPADRGNIPEDCLGIARELHKRSRIAVEARNASMLLGYSVLNFSLFGHAFIRLIMVRNSQRRHGVGSAILRTLESQCGAVKLFT
ncbi:MULTISPECIES: GNAT family N-acetyltransferase [unclassified Pseudomonas]|uniref:GNAT family N-acetyltransferase n=1 Tax=unclassified Pseudomonas TaxID=196821 RepID=UPI003A862AC6